VIIVMSLLSEKKKEEEEEEEEEGGTAELAVVLALYECIEEPPHTTPFLNGQ